jgi:hypothetical protein
MHSRLCAFHKTLGHAMQRAEGTGDRHNGREFIKMVRAHALQAALAPAPSAAVEVVSTGVHGYVMPFSVFEVGDAEGSPEDGPDIASKVRPNQAYL